MQFKSLAMIICLTAGSVLSAPINNSLDHSLERRSINALIFAFLKGLGVGDSPSQEADCIGPCQEDNSVQVPQGPPPKSSIESGDQASSSAVSQ
jgi:hypothetical protein